MENKVKTWVKVFTKFNYYNTNNRWLEVVKFDGTVIKCIIPLDINNNWVVESDDSIQVDFLVCEVKEII